MVQIHERNMVYYYRLGMWHQWELFKIEYEPLGLFVGTFVRIPVLLKIHISNFHRISIFLAEVRLASGPCLESRLLFFSQLSHYSLSLSLSLHYFSHSLLLATSAFFHKPDRDSRLGNVYSYGFSRGVVLALYLPVILMSIHAIPVGWLYNSFDFCLQLFLKKG